MKYFAYFFLFLFLVFTSCSKNTDDGGPTNGQSSDAGNNGGNNGGSGGDPTGRLAVGVTYFVGGLTLVQTVTEDGQVSDLINLSETHGMPNGYRWVQSGRNYLIVKDDDSTR